MAWRIMTAMALLPIATLAAAPLDAAESAVPQAGMAIASAFAGLCLSGDITPQAVLARASANGWHDHGGKAPADFDAATERFRLAAGDVLLLKTGSSASAGERRETCGLSTPTIAPGIVEGTKSVLGFKPILDMGSAATFYAIRGDSSWKSGAGLDRAAFQTAKAEGRFYSIMVASTDSGSSLIALQVRPDMTGQ